jgi:hypothetical protein
MTNTICGNCGTTIQNGTKFCPSCGAINTPPQPQYAQAPYQNVPPPVQQYAPPQQQYYQNMVDNSPMSVGQYILTFILSGIPIVGFILLLMWAFGSSTNINKKNYARAVLIMGIIVLVIYILIFAVAGATFMSVFNNGGGYGSY